jgi:hypothetical protein
MKGVQLTQGKVALVDDDDYEALALNKWKFSNRGYAARLVRVGTNKQKTVLMHRTILGITDKNIIVDHINGNKLDNRRSNLRECNLSQNSTNRRLKATSRSGFKGVYWAIDSKKWRARITSNHVVYHLGLFANPEDAHKAYVEASIRLHKEFANDGKHVSTEY